MFQNATVYRIAEWQAPPLAAIEERLQAAPFVACGATQTLSVGWVPPRGERHAALAEAIAGQIVLTLAQETRAVPASAVRDALQARLDAIEADAGYRPKGKAARELKEQIVHALLPRAFPRRRTTRVWIAPLAGRVWIDAAAPRQADTVLTLLADALGGGLRLAPLATKLAPATAMADWLATREPPAGFSVDRDCELRQPDSGRATVRYTRHGLDGDDIAAHVRAGKRPTQLALTWASRVSFVLADTLSIKRIQRLDGVRDEAASAGDPAGEHDFDADVALATGELAPLLEALVEALGGFAEDAPAASTPVAAGDVTAPPPWETATP